MKKLTRSFTVLHGIMFFRGRRISQAGSGSTEITAAQLTSMASAKVTSPNGQIGVAAVRRRRFPACGTRFAGNAGVGKRTALRGYL